MLRAGPLTVGARVAFRLAFIFLPLVVGVLGVSLATYLDSLKRTDALLVARLDAAVIERRAALDRSALLARAAITMATSPDSCEVWAREWNAASVWASAEIIAADGATVCRLGGAERAGLGVRHLTGNGRVSARLLPDTITRTAQMESFVQRGAEWRSTEAGAAPGWAPASPFPTDLSAPWTDEGRDGMRYRYTATSLGEGDAIGVLALPVRLYRGAPLKRLIMAAGLLTTLLVLSLATAWFSIDRNLLQHVEHVRRVAGRLARGEPDARVDTEGMPRELRHLARSLNHLAARVARRTREAQRSLEAERGLLRELHHRVKNNFQIIASLLAVQRRSLSGPHAARETALLQYPEDRVAAMATAYRVSYAKGEIGDVPLPELTEDILSSIQLSAGLSPTDLCGDRAVEGTTVDLDTAVPIALLMVETIAPVAREAARLDGDVRVDMLAGVAGLNILVAGPAPELDDDEAALSRRFTQAYLRQVDGQLDVTRDGAFYRARIRVPVEKLRFANED